MALYGSTIPTDHGEFVVTIICPNSYAQQKLMQACAGIVPSAGEPGSPPPNCDGHHATEAPMPPHLAEVLLGREDDEGDLVGENYGGTE